MRLNMDEVLAALLRHPSTDMAKEEREAHRGRIFYGQVLYAAQRRATEEIDSIDFDIVDGRPYLLYSEKFLQKAGLHEAVLHLERAALGLILDHIPRALEMAELYPGDEKERVRRMIEVATYVAATEHIKNDPYFADAKFGTVPLIDAASLRDLIEKAGYKIEIKDGQSVEYYFNRVMPASEGAGGSQEGKGQGQGQPQPGSGSGKGKKKGKGRGKGEGDGQPDQQADGQGDGDGQPQQEQSQGHWSDAFPRRPKWSEQANKGAFTPSSAAQMFRAHAKALLSKAREDTIKSRGLVPSDIEEWLNQYLRESQVPWWRVLGDLIASHHLVRGERSPAVFNRRRSVMGRLIMPVFGRDVDDTFVVFLFLDTSGSMSADDMAVCLREVQALLDVKEEMTVRVMQGDAAVHVDVVYKSGERVKYVVVGRGGTDFNVYFEYMRQYLLEEETRPNLVIIGTDGCCPTVPPSLRLPDDIPVIWLLTSPPDSSWWKGIEEDGYGKLLYVDPAHRSLQQV